MKRAAILTLLAISSVCAWKLHQPQHPPGNATAVPAVNSVAPNVVQTTKAAASRLTVANGIASVSQTPQRAVVAHAKPISIPAQASSAIQFANAAGTVQLSKPAPARLAAIKTNLLSMPLHFEENRGQAPAQYDYLSRGHGCSVLLRSNEARIVVSDKNGTGSAALKLQAASDKRKAVGMEPLPAQVNYYRGKDSRNWQIGVPTNAKIKYEGIYPGIDVVYYGNQQKLEYDFVVAPHADPNVICWIADGADSVKLDKEGTLVLTIGGHDVQIKKPLAYQIENGARKIVEAGYRVENNSIRLALNEYDSNKTLVIDPVVQFIYSTYLGGTTGDSVDAVAVDRQGRIYVAGWSMGTGAFPVAGNPPPPTGTFPVGTTAGYVVTGSNLLTPNTDLLTHASDNNKDAFVAILNPDESQILYATYLGGNAADEATAIALDPAGYIYLAGNTASTDFPTLKPAQSANAGGIDGFVVKLANTGQMIYSTYVGSESDETIRGVGVNSTGEVRLVGSTGSPYFYGHTPLQPGTTQGMFTLSVKQVVTLVDGSKTIFAETTSPIYETGTYNAATPSVSGQEQYIEGALNNLQSVRDQGYFSVFPATKDPLTNATQRTFDLTLELNSPGAPVYSLVGGTTTGIFPSVTLVADVGSNTDYFTLDQAAGSGQSPVRYWTATQYITIGGSDWPIFSGSANVNGATYPVGVSGTSVTISGNTYPIRDRFIEINNTSYPIVSGTVTLGADLSFTNTDGGAARIPAGTYSVDAATGTVVKIKEFDTYTFDEKIVSIGGGNYSVDINPGAAVGETSGTLAYGTTVYSVIRQQVNPSIIDTVVIPNLKSWLIYNQFINIAGHNWPVYQGAALVNGRAYRAYNLSIRIGSGLSDAFALRLTGTSQPVIATAGSEIIGGSGDDIINGVATDLNGVFYFAGQTEDTSRQGTVSGKFYYPMIGQATNNDIYVLKFASEGAANAVALDLNGFSYFGGTTPAKDFPMFNALQTYPQTLDRSAPNDPMGSGYNGFVVKMDQGFANTIFSTYLGGSKHDYVRGIAVDFRGYVYITGETESFDFPTLGNAVDQSSDRNHGNAFLSVLVPAGNELRYSTYFGGAETDWGFGVAVSPIRNPIAYVVGYTNSDDFPTQSGTANPVVYPSSREPDTYTSGFVTAFQDPSVDLQLEAITTDLAVPIAGQNLTYTVTVKNLSTTTDCQDARVSQVFSDNLQFVSAAGASISNFSGGSLDITTNTVSVNLGPIMAGREVSYTVTVKVTAAAVISTTATVQAEYDNNSTNNSLSLQQIARPLISLTVPQPQASENGTPGIFTIVRQGDLSPALTIKYTLGGNSTNGVNYATLSGIAVLASSASSVNVVVAPYPNTTAPGPGAKTVVLTVQKGINYETGTVLTGTVNIADVAADVVSLAVPDGVGSKNSGDPVVFTVSRTGNLGQALPVTYNLFGSAANGLDYQILGADGLPISGTTGSVTIPANTTSANVVVSPISDSISGQPVLSTTVGLEVVVVPQTLAAPGSGYTLGASTSGTGTILDVNPDSVDLAVIQPNAAASGTSGLFRIMRAGDESNLTIALSVQYTMGGTAISGSDYAALSGVATIPAGSASVDVPIDPILNITGTTDKTAILTLSPTPNPKSYTLGAGTTGTVTIFHYAGAIVTVTAPVQIPATATSTGTTNGYFIISRTGPTASPLPVNYSMGGSASSGVDYVALSGTTVIPAGQANVTVTLTPQGNGLSSGSESAILAIQPSISGTDYLPGSPSSASVSINNASGVVRPLVTLSIISNDASLTSGSGVLVFRVTRTGDSSQAVSVNYSIGGSAINGSDYQNLTGAIALPANVTSADIVVTPIWSSTVQPVKVVGITLTDGIGYHLGLITYGSGTITYVPWDTVALSVTQSATSETGTSAVLRVMRTGDVHQPITVNYAVGGSAISGTNYVPLTGSAVIAASSSTADITIIPINDHVNTPTNTVFVTLASGSNYTLAAPVSGTATITNVPDNTVSLVVTARATEFGQNGSFQIRRTGPVTRQLVVKYSVGGTAIANKDYVALSGTAILPVGASYQTVLVKPLVNAASQASPYVRAVINSSIEYAIAPAGSGTVSIVNYAGPVTTVTAIQINATVTGTPGIYRIKRTGVTTAKLVVKYAMKGTATNRYDYSLLSGSATIPVGKSYVDVTLHPINHSQPAGLYTAIMTLSTATNYLPGPPSSATVNIRSYGPAPVQVTADAANSSNWEGYGSVRAVFQRSGSVTDALTVYYTTAGTAASGVNFTPVSGWVTIPAGSDRAGVNFQTIDDKKVTPDMSLIVVLKAGAGYTITAPGEATLTIKDADLTGPTF